jgi:hypothetical protein
MPIRIDELLSPRQLESTRIGMPKANLDIARSAGAGISALGKQLGETVETIGEANAKMKEIDSAGLLAGQQNNISREFSRFQSEEMAKETDPDKLLKMNADFWEKHNPVIEKLTQRDAATLNIWHDSERTRAEIEIRKQADLRRLNRTKREIADRFNYAKEKKDPEEYRKVKEQAKQTFPMNEEQEAALDLDFNRSVTIGGAYDLLENDPLQLLRDLTEKRSDGIFKFAPLSPAELDRLEVSARLKIEERRTAQFKHALEALDKGPIDESRLDQGLIYLRPEDRAALKKYNKRSAESVDAPLLATESLIKLRDSFANSTVPEHEYQRLYNDALRDLVGLGLHGRNGRFNKSLNFLSPETRKMPMEERWKKYEGSEMEIDAQELLYVRYKKGAFGDLNDERQAEIAQRTFATYQAKLFGIGGNKQVTADNLQEWVHKLTAHETVSTLLKRAPESPYQRSSNFTSVPMNPMDLTSRFRVVADDLSNRQ